jgi:transcription elongation factor GreA
LDKISEYAHVMAVNCNTKEKMEFQIVGSVEAKPFEGKISNESPVGKAMLGHTIDDIVEITVPAGMLKLKIIGISR